MVSLSDMEATHHTLAALLPPNTYFRLDPPIVALPGLDIMDGQELERIQRDSRGYLRRNRVLLDRLEERLQPSSCQNFWRCGWRLVGSFWKRMAGWD